MDMSQLLVQILAGAVGGNAAGAMLKNLSLGTVGNSIAGAAGGGLGGLILNAVAGGGMDSLIGQIVGGGIGGTIVMAVVGMIRKSMAKNG